MKNNGCVHIIKIKTWDSHISTEHEKIELRPSSDNKKHSLFSMFLIHNTINGRVTKQD